LENNKEERIIVIDSFPGSGKTSWAIQHINALPDDTKIIYITPFLTEVQRIMDSCREKYFSQPDKRLGAGSKLTHLISLVSKGCNIVSTHALFRNITDELIASLKAYNYVLFLDEVFQTVDKFEFTSNDQSEYDIDKITKQDVDSLIAKGYISIDKDDYSVKWLDNDNLLSWYIPLKRLADRGLLFFVSGSLLLWSFPIEVFREGIFSKIYIMTYMFEAQLQSYYYNYFDIQYIKYHAYLDINGKYKISKTVNLDKELQWKNNIKEKIHIIDNPKLNRIGDIHYDNLGRPYKSALSVNWYNNNKELLPVIKKNVINFYVNIVHSKAGDILWTCFKEDAVKIKSPHVSIKNWLAINARSINEYGDRHNVAYLVNRYLDIFYEKFFDKKGIVINHDLFALAEMIQWVWRSAVRNNDDITLYIPSKRMRTLLIRFLNNQEIIF
jgi:hypothetical protein